MITLHTFGRNFGLPDPSPFVTKAEILLKMAGQPYETTTKGFSKAPKSKLPYIRDGGETIADSTFIRWHLEKKYGVDFDAGLTAEQRADAWAYEKMAEEHLYFAMLDSRWMVDANFDKGPRLFFDKLPAPMRPVITAIVRRQVKRNLWGQGMGRHARPDIERLAMRDVDAIAAKLGGKPFLMGDKPCGADASIWSSVAGTLCPHFSSPVRDHAARHANLVAYCDRGMKLWFPEVATKA